MKVLKLIFLPIALVSFLLALVLGTVAYLVIQMQVDDRNIKKPIKRY